MRLLRVFTALVICLLLVVLGAACAGAKGEKGDTGAQGIQGVPGPDMVVAMGTISGPWGTIATGYNVTSCTWNGHDYEIVLKNIQYEMGSYVTLVTSAMGGTVEYNGSDNGTLIVGLYDSAGTPISGVFSFIVLQAP